MLFRSCSCPRCSSDLFPDVRLCILDPRQPPVPVVPVRLTPFHCDHETQMERLHSGFIVFVVASTTFTSLCAAFVTSALVIGLCGTSATHAFLGLDFTTCPVRRTLEHAHHPSDRLVGMDLDQHRVRIPRVAVSHPREIRRQGGCFAVVDRGGKAFQTPEEG